MCVIHKRAQFRSAEQNKLKGLPLINSMSERRREKIEENQF